VVEPATSPTVAASLAKYLRELRTSRFPDAKLTQTDLAQALSAEERVAVSTISAWENTRTPTLPPPYRLSAYAQFFATERSLEGPPHLVPLSQLSAQEHKTREELERKLFRLRDDDAGTPPRQSWRFDDGAPITVICSDLKESDEVKLGPLSDVDNPNYTELYSYADLDALVALLEHLRSSNPEVDIHRVLASETDIDLINHLVLLGGIAWNEVTRRLNDSVGLPVRQVVNEKIHSGEVFEVVDGGPNHGEQFLPRWRADDPGTQEKPGVLLEDVAMLARLPNPYNGIRTLTYCNGVHSRGVLGAVKCLTHPTVRGDNERYLAEAFHGSDRFVVLMRVPVFRGQTVSPSLKNPGTVLYQWPEEQSRN